MNQKKIDSIIDTIENRWRASKKKFAVTHKSHTSPSGEDATEDRNYMSYESGDFELDIQRILDLKFPFSCLPGIQIYSPRSRGKIDFGSEVDHLLHFKRGVTDYLVLIESKLQALEISDNGWRASYTNPDREVVKKCAKKQVNRQIQTLSEYIRPVGSMTDLKFLGLVVSIDPHTPEYTDKGYDGAILSLMPVRKLILYLQDFFSLDTIGDEQATCLMVAQSPMLALLRMSCPLTPLGHPELKSAISYVERCRRSLDESIYRDFEPSRGHWAINGSAGMGKSVLLAYTAAVLCSGYRLHEIKTGESYVGPAKDVFSKIGFKDDKKLSIGILAMSSKQLDSLRLWFNFFVDCFQAKDEVGQITFRKPEFILVRTLEELHRKKWSALLVDECHDILPAAERVLVDSYKKENFFLVVACDRHQKLRYSSNDSRILNGLDFGIGPHGIHTKRLKQNYRNPTPINIASLALMFRWFADGGNKVIPTKEQLVEQFGFLVEGDRSSGLKLKIQTDAHPANAWSHTVASFPDAQSAYKHLRSAHLSQQEVLWVRFSDEDLEFDYESLGREFIYHVCRSVDAQKISDKYIKGQDYPVVVIEGFPRFMDQFTTPDQEEKMWAFRRELYLCASRATCFLYLVCNVPRTDEIKRIQKEISSLVGSLAVPSNYGRGGTKIWEFEINRPDISRNLEVFRDNIVNDNIDLVAKSESAQEKSTSGRKAENNLTTIEGNGFSCQSESEEWDLWVHGPITLNEFALEVGRKPYQVLAELIKMKVFANLNTLLDIPILERLTEVFGGTLRLYKDDSEDEETVEDNLFLGKIESSTSQIKSHNDINQLNQYFQDTNYNDGISLKNQSLISCEEKSQSPEIKTKDDSNSSSDGSKFEDKQIIDEKLSFRIGTHTTIRAGSWIEDSDYGIGRVLNLNTRAGYADSHRVWFARSNAIQANYPLRGRLIKLLTEERVPNHIREACPLPPWT